ncbi:cysteine-rich protein 2-binding protein [Entomortierella parvispora]|uniref:Cysteine-rich protein 2-binding protein n=1 Tax=Entomortierella parvispora TaxID=205924 RepID=A0A9P3HJI2_9FUNG|nr:cysteine-rich protein 2-binding protein [Entomortierella parvispora]
MAAHGSQQKRSRVTEFPYEPEELHWAADHKSNEEGTYCYCGKDKEPDEPMLPCQKCGQLFHSGCVSCLTKPLLKGDEFFKFECSVCTQGPEFFERAALSWVILVHLVLYNLMDAHPDQQYFRWKEEICKFIFDYWSYLLPDKEQSPTWNNTVASVLSVQNHIFLSGVETKGTSGWWTLIEKAPPDRNRKLKPKNKAVPKTGASKHSGSKTKDKRARSKGSPMKKKTRFDETSSDDDFHTSAKPRPTSSAPNTRIKSRQFSLSSGSSLSSAGDSDDSADGGDNFWKSDDEEEFRPMVYLHGIPACIQHHFNPSGLDFSGGPINLEEIFRLTDLIDEDSPGRLIHRVNSLGALAVGGKKKRRKSSMVDIKPETVQQIIDESHYVQDMSDISDDDIGDRGSSDVSDIDSDMESDGSDGHLGGESIREAHGRAMAAKRTAGKRFKDPLTSPKKGGRKASFAMPTSGGKYGRRKSSLKEPAAEYDSPRKMKNVSMADEYNAGHTSAHVRIGGGKKFSQAHINAMTNSNQSKPRAKAKVLPKSAPISAISSANNNTPASAQTNSTFQAEPSLDGLSLTEAAPKTPPVLTAQQLQRQQEWHILQVLEDASKASALPTVAARFKRKLQLKRLKAFLHLPIFDMEKYMHGHLASPLDLTPLSKHIPPDPYELRRIREEQFQAKIQKIDHTPYANSFASRLLGNPVECLTRKPWDPVWKSPFSGKVLSDFIWRDYESRSAMMEVLDEIKVRDGHPSKTSPWTNPAFSGLLGKAAAKKRKRDDTVASFGQQSSMERHQQLQQQLREQERQQLLGLANGAQGLDPLAGRAPIDYCFFRREHLVQVNDILCRRFWPGIDMTEALQYPEYSVVVLYKKLVVGCAFMTPEGYITYVAVSAGWEKAGIGQFMLYHLMQASNGRDITLHVSANNPAMIMYQKFGFKPEQFLINFYKEYLPPDSAMCHNAFFVRLRR